MKQVRRLPQAEQDIKDAVWHYAAESMSAVSRFLTEIARAATAIGATPGIGSPRYAHALDMPGLRVHQLRFFPYLLFYFERDDHIDLVRVLHMHRDILNVLLTID
jgi:toxin ParE1/3/4